MAARPPFQPKLVYLAEKLPQCVRRIGDFSASDKTVPGHGYMFRLGEDRATGKSVILQEFREPLTKALLHRFHSAIYALATVSFPTLATLVGFSVDHPYTIIIENPGGSPLPRLLRKEFCLSGANLVVALATIARSVQHLHSCDIMFRSLSPWSAFADSALRPVLCDFSECLVDLSSAARPLEKHCGSSQFCAPECHVSTDYTAAVDVYSFGMLAWSMCECNERPYGAVASVLVPAMVTVEGRRPQFDRTPPALRRLVRDCWSPDPLSRPTFSDVVQRLRQLNPSAVDSQLEAIARAARTPRPTHPVLVDIEVTLAMMRAGSTEAIATAKLPPDGTGVTLERFDAWYTSVLPKLECGVCGEVVLGIQRLVNRDPHFLARLDVRHFFSLRVLSSDGYAKFSFSFLVHIFCNMPECVSLEMRPWIAANIARDTDRVCILFGYFLTEFVSHQTAELAIDVVFGFATSFVNSPNAHALLVAAYQLAVRFPHLRVRFPQALAGFFMSFLRSTNLDVLRTTYNILLNLTPTHTTGSLSTSSSRTWTSPRYSGRSSHSSSASSSTSQTNAYSAPSSPPPSSPLSGSSASASSPTPLRTPTACS
jgi:hypothetical protein